jgi:hypothetical protein
MDSKYPNDIKMFKHKLYCVTPNRILIKHEFKFRAGHSLYLKIFSLFSSILP